MHFKLNLLNCCKQCEDLCAKTSSNRSMRCIIKAIAHNDSVKKHLLFGKFELTINYILLLSKKMPKRHKTAQERLLEK